jgi:hypothetical protein
MPTLGGYITVSAVISAPASTELKFLTQLSNRRSIGFQFTVDSFCSFSVVYGWLERWAAGER